MRPNLDLAEVLEFASQAHSSVINPDGSRGQVRKYTGEPYIAHPMAVAGIVATVAQATQVMIAAALLHDVYEDTPVTLDEIRKRFGEEVAQLVDWLSDKSTSADGNRRVRKERERERLARAPWAAQTIKLADLISNTMSIVALDPKFARVYLGEKAELLGVLAGGDARLHAWATRLCREGIDKLERDRLDKALSKS